MLASHAVHTTRDVDKRNGRVSAMCVFRVLVFLNAAWWGLLALREASYTLLPWLLASQLTYD